MTISVNKCVRKSLPIDSLRSSDAVNIRASYNYDLASMKEQIIPMGGVTDPLSVEALADGTFMILRGNRRFRAACELRADPNTDAALVKALAKFDCFVWSDLTEEKRQELIHDHGGFKPLSREDTVKAVWALDAKTWTERRIISQMYHTLARYAGSEDQLPQIEKIPPGAERDAKLVAWLHSTMGSYLLKIPALGDYCKAQFLAWEKSKDGHDSKCEVKLTRPRVKELLKAKAVDGDSWHYETGGAEFNKLLAQYKTDDAAPKKPKARPTGANLLEKVKNGIYRSPLAQAAIRVSVGEESAQSDLVRLDAVYVRVDAALGMIRRNLANVKDDAVRAFFTTLLTDASLTESPLAQIEMDFAPLLTGPVLRADNTPAVPEPEDDNDSGDNADDADTGDDNPPVS